MRHSILWIGQDVGDCCIKKIKQDTVSLWFLFLLLGEVNEALLLCYGRSHISFQTHCSICLTCHAHFPRDNSIMGKKKKGGEHWSNSWKTFTNDTLTYHDPPPFSTTPIHTHTTDANLLSCGHLSLPLPNNKHLWVTLPCRDKEEDWGAGGLQYSETNTFTGRHKQGCLIKSAWLSW